MPCREAEATILWHQMWTSCSCQSKYTWVRSFADKHRGETLRTNSLISVRHAWLLTAEHPNDGSARAVELERSVAWHFCACRQIWHYLLLTLCSNMHLVNWLFYCMCHSGTARALLGSAFYEWSVFTQMKCFPAAVNLAVLVLSAP